MPHIVRRGSPSTPPPAPRARARTTELTARSLGELVRQSQEPEPEPLRRVPDATPVSLPVLPAARHPRLVRRTGAPAVGDAELPAIGKPTATLAPAASAALVRALAAPDGEVPALAARGGEPPSLAAPGGEFPALAAPVAPHTRTKTAEPPRAPSTAPTAPVAEAASHRLRNLALLALLLAAFGEVAFLVLRAVA